MEPDLGSWRSPDIYRALTYIAVPLLGPHQPRYIGLTLYKHQLSGVTIFSYCIHKHNFRIVKFNITWYNYNHQHIERPEQTMPSRQMTFSKTFSLQKIFVFKPVSVKFIPWGLTLKKNWLRQTWIQRLILKWTLIHGSNWFGLIKMSRGQEVNKNTTDTID